MVERGKRLGRCTHGQKLELKRNYYSKNLQEKGRGRLRKIKKIFRYEFSGSFEPYVEFVLYSTCVLGSKGWAVGWGIVPLPYRPPDCRLRALDTLSPCDVCRGLVQIARRGEHRYTL
jgi:hypothetical protein